MPNAATIIKVPGDLPSLGSHHSSSLAYAFQTKVDGLADPKQFTPAQQQLSDAFSGAWMAFVKTGNPGWAPFKTAQGNAQVFTPTGVQQSTAFATDHQCGFWLPLNLP